MKLKNMSLPMVLACVVWICVLFGLDGLPAWAVEFVTEKQFAAAKSVYKDYPLKMLFRKFQESDAEKKREIRNMIIMKQVFSPAMKEKAASGMVGYDQTVGIIKEIGKDTLKLWVPETERYQNIHLGIDRIPVENKHGYEISGSNIGRYALVAYSLDGRIYKLDIRFEMTAPSGLHVKRDGTHNVVEWQQPKAAVEPVAYKVFVNDRPFSTSATPFARVPRTEGQVDTYHVKAVYRHGTATVDSETSEVVTDDISAREIANRDLAKATYDEMMALLTPADWEKGKAMLASNQKLFADHLSPAHLTVATGLAAFFKEIDGSDQIGGLQPATVENLAMAGSFLDRAEVKAKDLMPDVDVAFIVHMKKNENTRQKDLLAEAQRKENAGETYDRILAGLTPAGWQDAKADLYAHHQFLVENLDGKRSGEIDALREFFHAVDEGDRISQTTPVTASVLANALVQYQLAGQKAGTLPATMGVSFIPQLKIDENSKATAQLEKAGRERAALETYERILSKINPSEWEDGKALLYDQHQTLVAFLDPSRKETLSILGRFFKEIDSGDQLLVQTPASRSQLETALSFYRRSEEKADALLPAVDARFISQLKIEDISARQIALDEKNNRQTATKTYDRILLALNPSEWQDARTLLYDRRDFLMDYLPEAQKVNVGDLADFFKEIDGGDHLAGIQPAVLENLKMASGYYERAEEKARNFPEEIQVAFIPLLRLNENREQMNALRQAQAAAQAPAPAPEAQMQVAAAETAPVEKARAPEIGPMDRHTALQEGVKAFKSRQYQSSLAYFSQAYSGQIESIKHGKALSGLLALPMKLRAVIVFLVEFERAVERNDGEQDLAIEDIAGDIEVGTGLWAGISETRRNKLLNYISR